jgi:Sulfotransferase family
VRPRRNRIPVRAVTRLGALRPEWFARRVRRPHFIVGCGRSGTTLLSDLFDGHPEVASFPSEANELWHPRLYPWHSSELDVPPFFVDPHGFTEASLRDRTPKDDLRLKAAFGAFQTLVRRPVFLNKSVMVTFMIDRIVELFPDARFIQLHRDGRAVALSWVKKEARKLEHPRYRDYGIDGDDRELMETYIRYWQAHVLHIDEAVERLGLRRDGRYFEMSYEGLCAAPQAELGRLADFMGIAAGPFTEADLSHIRNMNHKAQAELGDALGPLTEAGREALAAKGHGAEVGRAPSGPPS